MLHGLLLSLTYFVTYNYSKYKVKWFVISYNIAIFSNLEGMNFKNFPTAPTMVVP